jgi:hypothetical protein
MWFIGRLTVRRASRSLLGMGDFGVAENDPSVFRTKVKAKSGGRGGKRVAQSSAIETSNAPASPVPPPRRSLMEALREAFVPQSADPPSPDATPSPRRRKRPASSAPDAASGAMKFAAQQSASGAGSQTADIPADSEPSPPTRKTPRPRAKGGRLFTELEVEEAEVIIIRRR